MGRMTVQNQALSDAASTARMEAYAGMLAQNDLSDVMFNCDTGRTFVVMGTKGSGKSYTCLSFVYDALMSGRYTEMHLVIPSFDFEELGSYSWLSQFDKIVYIYTTYDAAIAKVVNSRARTESERLRVETTLYEQGKGPKPKPYRSMFWIDDATQFADDLTINPEIAESITMARHYRMDFIMVVHAAKSVLSPLVRANVDRLFVFRFTNRKILDSLHEEWLSMDGHLADFKDFMRFFSTYVLDGKELTPGPGITSSDTRFQGICIDLRTADNSKRACFASCLSTVHKYTAAMDPTSSTYNKKVFEFDATKRRRRKIQIVVNERGDCELVRGKQEPKKPEREIPAPITGLSTKEMIMGGRKRLNDVERGKVPAPVLTHYIRQDAVPIQLAIQRALGVKTMQYYPDEMYVDHE